MSRPDKPAYGSPCNGCGRCCEKELCPLGVIVFARIKGPCPALVFDEEGVSGCGLVVDPKRFAPTRVARYGRNAVASASAMLIGRGLGCDAILDDGEARDMAQRERMRREALAQNVSPAMKLWGVYR